MSEDLFCGQCGFNLMAQAPGAGATQKDLKLDDIQMSLAIVYLKKGEYQKAIDVFEKILKSKPDNTHASRLLKQTLQLQRESRAVSGA
ncbi:MAG: tetratricopeptide repeat protein [Calditrichia bacterium]